MAVPVPPIVWALKKQVADLELRIKALELGNLATEK